MNIRFCKKDSVSQHILTALHRRLPKLSALEYAFDFRLFIKIPKRGAGLQIVKSSPPVYMNPPDQGLKNGVCIRSGILRYIKF